MIDLKKLKTRFKVTDRFVYLCAGLFMAVALFLLYRNFGERAISDISDLISQKDEMEQELIIKEENLAAYDETLRLLQELTQADVPREIIPADEPAALLYIFNQIREYGFVEPEFKIMPRRGASDGLLLRPVQISVNGPYDNCIRLMYAIGHSKYYSLTAAAEMTALDGETIKMSQNIYLIIDGTALSGEDVFEADDITEPNADVDTIRNPFVFGKRKKSGG